MELAKKENQQLNIGYNRLCDCKPTHINCLNAKEWVKQQVAVWEFFYEKRDIREKDIHPAVFPISLPKKCIELFTHKGELVLDPFAGIGSTLLAARDLERNAVGFDLNEKTLGVIGTGKIGANVIKIAKGFNMQILASDPCPNEELSKTLDEVTRKK